jgi:nicotinic acid mononucleotide adenylyltransferase
MSSFNLPDMQSRISSVYNAPDNQNIFSLYATGGGISLSSWLLTVPGASNSVMSIQLPYSRHATLDLLTYHEVLKRENIEESLSFCSSDMALYLAEAAYRDAIEASGGLTQHFSSKSSSGTANLQSSSAIHSAVHTPYASSAGLHQYVQDSTNSRERSIDHPSQKHFNVFGVSCTAALVSGSPKRGAHRCHIAIATAQYITSYTLTLDKSLGRTRNEEDIICSQLLFHAIQEQSQSQHGRERSSLADSREFGFLSESDQLSIQRNIARNLLSDVSSQHSRRVLFFPPGESSVPNLTTSIYDWVHSADVKLPSTGSLVFPGSFNPLHEGHIDLVLAAIERYQTSAMVLANSSASCSSGSTSPPSIALSYSASKQSFTPPLVVFEISAVNADKPPISLDVLEARIQQFDPNINILLRRLTERCIPYAVAITSEPFFTRKAEIFPQSTFLVGADTLERLFNLKYYLPTAPPSSNIAASSHQIGLMHLVKAMGRIADKDCKFIVGGRIRLGLQTTSTQVGDEISLQPIFQTMEAIFKENTGAQCIFELWPDMFQGITEEEFRSDLSSTEIRMRAQQALLGDSLSSTPR